jgi:type I restriction enzyme S subunit
MTDMVKNELIKTKIPWTPYAPIGWDIKRAKFIFKSKKEINSQMQCNDRLALTLKGVIDRFEGDNIGLNPNDLRTYQIFQPNELVFKLLDLDNKKTSRVGFVHKKGIMSSAYIRVLENPNMNMRYFYYQYFDLYQRFIFNDIGQGVRATMSSSDLLNIPILIPPLETQNAIVNYLDRKTQQIQEFITKKERLIELLEEQKQSLIFNALTKGIGKVNLEPIKDSWLQEKPINWKVHKGKSMFKIIGGYAPSDLKILKESEYNLPNSISYYKVNDLNNVDGFLLNPSSWRVNSNKLRTTEKGTILLPKRGAAIMTNKVTQCSDSCVFDSNIMGIKVENSIVHTDYICLWLKTRNLIELADVTTIPQLNNKHIYPLFISLPDLDEQNTILDYIKEKTSHLGQSISIAKAEIEKTKEYQESLITQVVSGQLKVPEKTYSNVHYREFDMVAEQGSSYHT